MSIIGTLAHSVRLLGVAAAVAGFGAFGGVAPASAPVDAGTLVLAGVDRPLPDQACTAALLHARPVSALLDRCGGPLPGRF